jgi:hypothetical protein
MRKLAQEEFINRASTKHNHKYDYSRSVYVGSKNKLIIICPIHGDFLQSPNRHLQGDSCPQCGFERTADNRRNDTEKVFDQAAKVHNNNYDYSQFIYKNNCTKGVIICPKHGVFEQIMDAHINQKQGCPNCSNIISKPETEWLNYLGIEERNRQPKKFKINGVKIKPDAYDPATNTIYEFYGDFYHGNPKRFNATDMNPLNHKSYGELFSKTLDKELLIKLAGYNLVTIWESDWNTVKKLSKQG